VQIPLVPIHLQLSTIIEAIDFRIRKKVFRMAVKAPFDAAWNRGNIIDMLI